MNVAALFMRACDSRGDVYAPYSFEGDWTEEEKNIIRTAIDPHVPKAVDSMFNNWRFCKWGSSFSARRFTWETVWGADSVQALGNKLASYYMEPA